MVYSFLFIEVDSIYREYISQWYSSVNFQKLNTPHVNSIQTGQESTADTPAAPLMHCVGVPKTAAPAQWCTRMRRYSAHSPLWATQGRLEQKAAKPDQPGDRRAEQSLEDIRAQLPSALELDTLHSSSRALWPRV